MMKNADESEAQQRMQGGDERASPNNNGGDNDDEAMDELLQDVEELTGPNEVLADYELDCYPYTFTPLLLFSPSSYFDKVSTCRLREGRFITAKCPSQKMSFFVLTIILIGWCLCLCLDVYLYLYIMFCVW
jgi:hypothetical protein